jgi:UDP-N-acetylmuramoyl-L-alanyl-D-glutamate--2,6-diaminopimelate ligase
MKLKKLIKDIPNIQVKGSKEIDISGVCSNSKLIVPGNLFIAKKGLSAHGVRYTPEAVQTGATAILSELYDPSLNVVQVIHPQPAEIEGLLAARFHQFPSDELFLTGITGTNGKTTTSFLVRYLLDQIQLSCGLIGTIEYIIGKHRYQATHTTPDVTANHRMLREMITQGCKAAVMEVTSHAMNQKRVDKVDFDVAVFTNLTHDHLDYHKTMEEYAAAKNKLFRQLGKEPSNKTRKKIAIVNGDSPWTPKIIEGCKAKIFTYGIDTECDLQGVDIHLKPSSTELTILYEGKRYACQWPLIGRFNVYNCLAAMAVLLAYGCAIEKIIELMNSIPSVNGRLEPVENPLDLKIFVDFAHTDDALINVFQCLREFNKGKLITVFGCGGDRDPGKRPKMAAASEKYSDFSIVTTDNPRTENPSRICDDIVKGFSKSDCYTIELDRRKAIEKAIALATPQDIILIAGKGHECYQIFAHQTIEFDDRKVASELCLEKEKV